MPLALTRNPGELIVIRDPDGEIVGDVLVTSIHGDKVTLGFDFPREYEINRQEIDALRHNGNGAK